MAAREQHSLYKGLSLQLPHTKRPWITMLTLYSSSEGRSTSMASLLVQHSLSCSDPGSPTQDEGSSQAFGAPGKATWIRFILHQVQRGKAERFSGLVCPSLHLPFGACLTTGSTTDKKECNHITGRNLLSSSAFSMSSFQTSDLNRVPTNTDHSI